MIEGRIFVAIFLLLVLSLSAQSIDPSTEACTNLTLNNDASRTDPSVTPPPFYIVTDLIEKYRGQYTAGQTYDITLMGVNATFTDFIVQARSGADGSLIGTFVENSADIQLLNCSGDPDSTITHTNNTDKSSLSFQWTAPGGAGGTVELRYSIFTDYQQIYYVNLNAADYRLSCQFTPTPIGEHSLVFRQPENCLRESCDYFLGLRQNMDNPSFIDVYLEGNAAGWIAIGFSLRAQLGRVDILGCRVDSGSVTVVDTWNPSAGQIANELDNTQAGLCVQATSFTNNRITCQFSRTIDVSDAGQDCDLDATTYWLLFGRRSNAQTSGNNLANDSSTSLTFSTKRYNPVRDNNTNNNTNMGCPPTPNENITYTFMFRSLTSDFYFAARVNPNNPLYVDMRIEGTANGWVGVGFTPNPTMDDADVLGCVRNPSDNMVAVVDSYNPVPRYTANRLDTNQDGVCIYNTSAIDGRLICSFSRLIAPVNTNDDHNLDQPLFQLYGMSSTGGPSTSSLAQHDTNPEISTERVILTNATGTETSDFPRRSLIKVHGILMLLAWPLLVVSAIFFAAWMKPALPNGEWFQIHRAVMIISLFLTAAGFVFIFVANAENPSGIRPGLISFACSNNTGHFVIGFIVFILQIINPLIAVFRCKPKDSKRWIFNISHGTLIGFTAELLALANVGLGIALFESDGCTSFEASEYRILWVYIAFVCFLILLQFSLFIIFTLTTFNAPHEKRPGLAPSLLKYFFASDTDSTEKKTNIEMTDIRKEKKEKNDPPPRKEPSEDSPIRWGAFAIFALVTLSVMVTLIIMISIEE